MSGKVIPDLDDGEVNCRFKIIEQRLRFRRHSDGQSGACCPGIRRNELPLQIIEKNLEFQTAVEEKDGDSEWQSRSCWLRMTRECVFSFEKS